MGRYYGKVGYSIPTEIRPGVWEDVITEQAYFGSYERDNAKWFGAEQIHDDISVSNVISIVADAYAVDHIFAMRYIEWLGTNWVIADVVINRPRLDIRLGRKYNGPVANK